jgi:thioredoxin reductase
MVVIVGAGYSGLLCAKRLKERGVKVRVFDFREPGGELLVFTKIPEFREHYGKFIDEMNSAISEVEVERGCVVSANPVKVLTPRGIEIINDSAVIAAGAVDCNPWTYGKRPPGVFSPETAIKLIAYGYSIGRRILLAGEDKVLDLLETVLGRKCEVERTESTEVYVEGDKRVQSVEADGEEFKCDTLILFRGRKTFNPKNLQGELIGNAIVKGYDYSSVKKSVEDYINLKYSR